MDGFLSSPDPLNDSATYQSPAKSRRTSRARHSLPSEGSSPTKQTFELDVGNQLSPQKLRVTVEAGNSETENGYTHFVDTGRASPAPIRRPINCHRERTTTTTVPVKGLSDSEDETLATPKRGRGRPRKSAGTPVAVKKRGRTSTPTQKSKGRRSIGSLVDGDDEDDLNFLLGNGVEVGRGKGRSRSRSTKGNSRKSTPAHKPSESSERIVSSTTSKKGRGRRKTLMPDEVVVLEDETSGAVMENEVPIDGEHNRPLSTTDGNTTVPTSAYSTIRSTTTVGYGESDIILARFDPGNETPRKIGWSSPRMVDEPRLSSNRALQSYPSPTISPEKAPKSYYEEDGMGAISGSPEHRYPSEDQQYEDEFRDGGCEIREFDTILESEGFSMISVDSVPSLRGHMSSPANQIQEQESSRPTKNKNIITVQRIELADKDDSFSSIPEEVLSAATPGRKAQNPSLLKVQNIDGEDSFSSIPSEVLEAATPARKFSVSEVSNTTNPRSEKALSNVAPKALEIANLGQEMASGTLTVENSRESKVYKDPYSVIPPAVMDAAAPAAGGKASMTPRVLTQAGPAPGGLDAPVPVQNLTTQQHHHSSAVKRLPTPEDTPSPGVISNHQSSVPIQKTSAAPQGTGLAETNSGNESSIISQMRSSPPSVAPRRYTYTAHLRQNRNSFLDKTQTPSIVFSSPSLPPPIRFSKGHPVLNSEPNQEQRPKLSPTVRAGRVLQGILSPSSPRSRAQSLGSPFKSPGGERKLSSSGVKEVKHSPIKGKLVDLLPNVDLTARFLHTNSNRNGVSTAAHNDDPFRSDIKIHRRSPPPEEKQGYALELPAPNRVSGHRFSSAARSENESIRSDDAMSWQADEELPMKDATASLTDFVDSQSNPRGSSTGVEPSYSDTEISREASERRWAAERGAVKKQIESANRSQVIVIDSDDNASAIHPDDDGFDLLLETLNSSSPMPQQQVQSKESNNQKPRRSKLPSPWRKNSKRLVYNDELSHLSSPPLAPGASSTKQFAKEPSELDSEMDLSEFLIPQKANFKPRTHGRGNVDLSALLASSPTKAPLPILTKSSQRSNSFQDKLVSHDRSNAQTSEEEGSDLEQIASHTFGPIPQKMEFNPRVRNRSMERSLLSSSPIKPQPTSLGIFGIRTNNSSVIDQLTPDVPSSSSEIKPLGMSSPSRTNSLPVPIRRASTAHVLPPVCTRDSSSSSLFNGEKEHQAIDDRTLKWTETVRLISNEVQDCTSPTKSCLRSPLKTPSAGSGSGNSGSPTKNVTFVSSSPVPSSPPEPLSSTTWSRDHWTLLDTILQTWKPEKQKEGQERRRRNSTRVISKLLGKNVNYAGEKMKLQQWHLEVVDEFRGYANGWREADIAKRVFALLLGEEKRALMAEGMRDGMREDMFKT